MMIKVAILLFFLGAHKHPVGEHFFPKLKSHFFLFRAMEKMEQGDESRKKN